MLTAKTGKPPTRYRARHSWYLSDAQELVRRLQEKVWPLGWHVALGGGVLNHGYSDDDLDLYVLPIYRLEFDHNIDDINTAIENSMDTQLGDYHSPSKSLNSVLPQDTTFASARRYLYGPRSVAVDVFVVRA